MGKEAPAQATGAVKKYLDRPLFSIYSDVFQGHREASRAPLLSHLRLRSQSPENRASSASRHASIQSEFCANSLQPTWIQWFRTDVTVLITLRGRKDQGGRP